jgi:hypothetical protein
MFIIYLNQKYFPPKIFGEIHYFIKYLLVYICENTIHLLAFQNNPNRALALRQTANATNVKVNAALPVERNGSEGKHLIQVTWAIGTQKWML